MSEDVVNIHLALPPPIKFEIEGLGARYISGRISMGDALEVRQLDQDMGKAEAAMYEAVGAASEASDGDDADKIGDAVVAAQEAIVAFEGAVDALSARLLGLFQVKHPDMTELPVDAANARMIVTVLWRRAFGASKAELELLGQQAQTDEDDGVPPTKSPPRASTSRNGSTASAKRSGTRRTTGSTSR